MKQWDDLELPGQRVLSVTHRQRGVFDVCLFDVVSAAFGIHALDI